MEKSWSKMCKKREHRSKERKQESRNAFTTPKDVGCQRERSIWLKGKQQAAVTGRDKSNEGLAEN